MELINLITFLVFIFFNKESESVYYTNYGEMKNRVDTHKTSTDTNVYPYVVAVLKKSSLLSTGALISDVWVITAADPLFLLRDATRLIQVRLGSMNYKKGGHVCPVKYIEFHPEFYDETPEYDVAMLRLAMPVQYSRHIYPIKLQTKPKDLYSTHFLATYWRSAFDGESIQPMNRIIERRRLQLSHLHPIEEYSCNASVYMASRINNYNIMCFDLPETDDSCKREPGVPVVLNRVLWGIVSSWVSSNCEKVRAPIYATKMFAPDILSWIYAVTTGTPWKSQKNINNMTATEFNYDEYF